MPVAAAAGDSGGLGGSPHLDTPGRCGPTTAASTTWRWSSVKRSTTKNGARPSRFASWRSRGRAPGYPALLFVSLLALRAEILRGSRMTHPEAGPKGDGDVLLTNRR